jgi:hypothetical protein
VNCSSVKDTLLRFSRLISMKRGLVRLDGAGKLEAVRQRHRDNPNVDSQDKSAKSIFVMDFPSPSLVPPIKEPEEAPSSPRSLGLLHVRR